jgi:2-polyprenyl-6-methoxyphenol hydroxylase-like FAD-dependent oxidoreductase
VTGGDDQRWYEVEKTRDAWFAGGEAVGERPARSGQAKTVREEAREVSVHAEADVLVVGGGPAGCAAATAAARLGADVLLVERYGHLGGLATGGLVFWIDRMTDWDGNLVISGYGAEVLDRMPTDTVYGPAPELWGSHDPAEVAYWKQRQKAFRDTVTWSPTVDPEWLKLASLDLLREAGARLLLHSWMSAALVEDGRVRGVVFESKQGRRAILAKVVVDASGDLDVLARAGAPYESDIDTGDVNHCINTAWTWAGVDMERWFAFALEEPAEHRALMERGAAELGYAEPPMASWRSDVALFLGPRLAGYSGLDVDDLTAVELESRRRLVAHLAWFRANAPGFEQAWLVSTAAQIGIRHTRRLNGVRKLTNADWKAGTRHADEIGVSPSPGTKFAPVSVPYGAIVSADLDNVLAGGRHIACDPSTQSFMREIPQCWLTGQAAGVAAALGAAGGVAARDVDVARIQDELRRQGVFLHGATAGVPARTEAS